MKRPLVQNTIVDEANGITYVVTANRLLSDGEIYRAVRLALLDRKGKRPQKGDTIEISMPR